MLFRSVTISKMMKTILLFLALVAFATCQNVTSVASADIKGYSLEYTLAANGGNYYFSLAYDNNTFGTDYLNFYVEVDEANNATATISIAVSQNVVTSTDPTTVTYTNSTKITDTSAVSCQNYSATVVPAGNSSFVYSEIVYPTGSNTSVPVTVEFTFAENCSTDNFGSDLWIWILVIVIVIIIVIVIVAAGVAGFLYWKKKQSGNYALYNDS